LVTYAFHRISSNFVDAVRIDTVLKEKKDVFERTISNDVPECMRTDHGSGIEEAFNDVVHVVI
jgi:hypothetical protein